MCEQRAANVGGEAFGIGGRCESSSSSSSSSQMLVERLLELTAEVSHHSHRHKKSPHDLLILVALLTPSQIQPTSPRSLKLSDNGNIFLKLSDNGNIFQTLSPPRAPSTGSAAFASVHRRASSTGRLLCQVIDFIIIAAILIIYIQTSKMTTTIEKEFAASSMFGSVSSPREGRARKPLAFPSPTVPEVRSKSWYCWY